MARKSHMLTILMALCGLVAACAASMPSVSILAKEQRPAQTAVSSDDSYLIGPGDLLAVDVWKEPELSKQTSVRLDGKVSLPLVNEVDAAGLTCSELRSQLTQKYQDFVSAPVVSVTVVESRSKKIYVTGKVAKPNEYPLQKNMTVVQAISVAGGLTEWADSSDIKLIRKMKGVQKTFRVNYDAIVSGKDLSQNVLLEPDDTIFVP
jgi:polysaccharide export outer membrane protein